MAIYTFKKYKISLQHDTKKTQGLRTGDIIRRQYFDGKNLVYSLMCVLNYGKEEVLDPKTGRTVERNYFIGALLEGDVPKSEQILDFARITNLFDTSRSGAMYLTGSDDQSPYMDVIDGIGRNASLCWPENVATKDYTNPKSQYIVKGAVDADYQPSIEDNYRVLHLKRQDTEDKNFIGIQQDFKEYVKNPNRVLISYKIKSSSELSCKISLGFQDGTRIDGEEDYTVTTDWQYKLHAVTIDYSGRYLRTLKLDTSSMKAHDEVWIADFNIILLSSVTNFNDACHTRVGKLTGIIDPVFGQLDSYGSYIQKLFASGSAHISGTLTAGDENGFAATFYAGKIHRNTFVNSLNVEFTTPVITDDHIDNPTGVGNVYKIDGNATMRAQTNKWLLKNIGQSYTLSFWLYAEAGGQLSVLQNNKVIGTIQIEESATLYWQRHKISFELQSPQENDDLTISLLPELVDPSAYIYFVAPQLESGNTATQYQPTDDVLRETNDYGAWFNRGGVGGTIQNPLLQLNFDGKGGIGTKNKSFFLGYDGSGYLANKNIEWDHDGHVVLGDDVTISWGNIANTPGWIDDWDSNKTVIGGESLITPKIFVGKKIENEEGLTNITGVYIGPNGNGAGVYGYKEGIDIFHINEREGKIAGWVIDTNKICTEDLKLSINAEGSIIAQNEYAEVLWGIYKSGKAIFSKNNVRFLEDGSAYFKGEIESASGKIANWTIKEDAIYMGQFSDTGTTASPEDITIGKTGLRGYSWYLNSNGDGALGHGCISWNSKGQANITSTKSAMLVAVDKNEDNSYNLKFNYNLSNDIDLFHIGDICWGCVNSNSPIVSWFRITNVATSVNTITVVMYPNEDVPGGVNYEPMPQMLVSVYGNADIEDLERSRNFKFDIRKQSMLFLSNIHKPILEDYNYSISIGRFPRTKALEKLPISENETGVMAQTVIAEKFYQLDHNGDVIPNKVDRGIWSLETAQSGAPYRFVQYELSKPSGSEYTLLEQHTVYHLGCKWGCLSDKTTDEPKWNSPSWGLLEGDSRYSLQLSLSGGEAFAIGGVDTVMSGRVFYGTIDITDDVMVDDATEVEWFRNSGNVPADNLWTPEYVDGNRLAIHIDNGNQHGVGSDFGFVSRSVAFVCRVFIPVEGEMQQIEQRFGFDIL